MALPPSPSGSLIPFAKTLWYVSTLGPVITFRTDLLQFLGSLFAVGEPSESAWMRVQLVGKRVGSTDPKEQFATTLDIANYTNGVIDPTWTDADFTTVQGQLSGLMLAWAANMPVTYTWTEARYYKMFFNPYTLSKPFAKAGPPAKVIPIAAVGGGGTHQAPQVAITTTDKTAYPRHWGRNYWPNPSGSTINTDGTIATATVDALGAAVKTCYDGLHNSQFVPVTPITVVDGVPTRGLLQVTAVQVDNVFDVIRRRRFPTATHKVILPTPPP